MIPIILMVLLVINVLQNGIIVNNVQIHNVLYVKINFIWMIKVIVNIVKINIVYQIAILKHVKNVDKDVLDVILNNNVNNV